MSPPQTYHTMTLLVVACILCGSRRTLNSVHELAVSSDGAQRDHG